MRQKSSPKILGFIQNKKKLMKIVNDLICMKIRANMKTIKTHQNVYEKTLGKNLIANKM